MRVAILGRTRLLLETARLLAGAGHKIALIGTCKAAEHDDIGPQDFEALSRVYGAGYFCDERINSQEILPLLGKAACDVAVSVNWLSIIGSEATSKFKHGILNAHAGDLPRYRGNACSNWAILNGEDHVGLCIHFMEPDRLDSGPVLLRDRYPLHDGTYIGDIYRWLGCRIPQMFVDAVNGLEKGLLQAIPQPQEPELSLRCYPRRPEDGRIDWRRSAQEIHRLVRASSRPFAGAFSFLEGERRVTIWRADIFEHPGPFCAVPGQILFRYKGDPLVACGDGVLRLTEVRLEGIDDETAKKEICRSLRNRLV